MGALHALTAAGHRHAAVACVRDASLSCVREGREGALAALGAAQAAAQPAGAGGHVGAAPPLQPLVPPACSQVRMCACAKVACGGQERASNHLHVYSALPGQLL